MGSIVPFLPDGMRLRDSVFEPHQIKAMSAAFNEVCEALKLDDDSSAKKVMAGTSLTWRGVVSAALRASARGCFAKRCLAKSTLKDAHAA
jgi:hypothetical protein